MPHHSSLTRICDRYGEGIFQEFFNHTLAPRPRRKLDPTALRDYVEKYPDERLEDYAQHFQASRIGVWLALKRLNITRKKTTLYKERDESKRSAFWKKIASIPFEKRVYVGESGIDSYVCRSFGWAKRDVKLLGEISGKRFDRESFIAAKCGAVILATFCFKGTFHTNLFNFWLETFLVPTLKPEQVVIMDNATFHKSGKIQERVVNC